MCTVVFMIGVMVDRGRQVVCDHNLTPAVDPLGGFFSPASNIFFTWEFYCKLKPVFDEGAGARCLVDAVDHSIFLGDGSIPDAPQWTHVLVPLRFVDLGAFPIVQGWFRGSGFCSDGLDTIRRADSHVRWSHFRPVLRDPVGAAKVFEVARARMCVINWHNVLVVAQTF